MDPAVKDALRVLRAQANLTAESLRALETIERDLAGEDTSSGKPPSFPSKETVTAHKDPVA